MRLKYISLDYKFNDTPPKDEKHYLNAKIYDNEEDNKVVNIKLTPMCSYFV